jgi:hypothetical protein
MQDLSYDMKNPLFTWNNWRFCVQLYTFENVYALDPHHCHVTADPDSLTVACDALRWGGGQESAVGAVHLHCYEDHGAIRIALEAQGPKTLRSVKVVLKGLPMGSIVNLREQDALAIPAQGLTLSYPNGWRGLYTPQVILQTAPQTYLSFRSLDPRVTTKRFVFLPRADGLLDVELIFEGLATELGTHLSVPSWEIRTRPDARSLLQEQAAFVEQAFGLQPWEQRPDVPAWAKEIALVAAVHCQHWSGYIFNDYARVMETMRWLAERIDGRRVLIYLPGWEGRYYWQYGDYRPDPRMGGVEGFRALVQEARRLNMHVMPMFGTNFANAATENYEHWGAPAELRSPGGYPASGSVDWDGARHYDHGWGKLLNPGAPTWQNRLVEQITTLIENYEFDGVFLDISAAWWNDPQHLVFEGTRTLIERIRAGHPEVLIAGEGWYDGMGAATPLMQSGHTDGVLHWHDQPDEDLFSRSNRSFAHLCLGDPSRGSTGVHELGYNAITRAPLRKGIIPTITFVEDTLQLAAEQVMERIKDAQAYAETYLNAGE